MAPPAPSWQLLQALSRRAQSQLRPSLSQHCQRRAFLQAPRRRASGKPETIDPATLREAAQAAKNEQGDAPQLKSGKLAPSMFDQPAVQGETGKEVTTATTMEPSGDMLRIEDYRQLKATVKDPRPRARIRWLRKKVIQDVKGRHRLTKAEKILKTERSHLAKSPFVKTSIKKLGPLARQITGKPIDEALLQMRFSKKKASKDVLKHLRYARDQAIVAKGMGLGKDVAPSVPRPEGKEEFERGIGKPVVIIDKKGKRRTVTDRSALYVDQAWVGRGTYGQGMDYRARGRAYRLRLPWTSITVVLKEEATRVREQKEREEKKMKKKPWVQLPDRPITAQRQFPLW